MNDEMRVIELEGIHNFRDYGGYAVSGGGHLRRGLLWRSGQHHGASDADLERIAQLRLGVVIDLRSDGERASHPCSRSEGFGGKVIFAVDDGEPSDTLSAAPHIAAAQAAQAAYGRDAAEMRERMTYNYTIIPFRPTLMAAMRYYLAELAKDTCPSLIHCMAGKDRTGVAVALLQRAVGVHPDDVMADYLLTNTAGDIEARIASGAQVVQDRSGPLDPLALRVLMGVEPEYLDTAFATIAERYGSHDAYLAQVLGADAALRDQLRARLVV